MFKRLINGIVFFWQRRTRGFDEPDLWDLGSSLAQIIAPRLKAFRDMEKTSTPIVQGMPFVHALHWTDDEEEINDGLWFAMVDKMYQAFQMIVDDEITTPSQVRYVREGLALFAAYMQNLWD